MKETHVTPATPTASRKLTLADIKDVREYERERADFRARMLDVKARRRISLGTLVTLMFENRDTMRLQIQEMIRVEKIVTDEGVLEELQAYNPMVPEAGQLCATMFIELTSDDMVREWLPKLAGIERSVFIKLANGDTVRGRLDAQHEAGLTRDDVTAAVHYLTFDFSPEQVDVFANGDVQVLIDLPNYLEATELLPATKDELLGDLRA